MASGRLGSDRTSGSLSLPSPATRLDARTSSETGIDPDGVSPLRAPEAIDADAGEGGAPLLAGMSGWLKTSASGEPGEPRLLRMTTSADSAEAPRPRPFGGTITTDANGRVARVETTSGRVREYERFDDGSLRELRLREKGGATTHFTRESADSSRWVVRDDNGRQMQTWQGEFDVNADGVHSVRPAGQRDWTSHMPDGSSGKSTLQDGRLTVFGKDGAPMYESRADGGVRFTVNGRKVSFDASGALEAVGTASGERRFERRDGALTRVVDVDAQGREIERFTAGEGRKAVVDGSTGDLEITTEDGTVRHNADGSSVTRDPDGSVTSVQRADGSARTFLYTMDDQGKQLAAIVDSRKTQSGDRATSWVREPGTNTFTSRDEQGRERAARRDVQVQPNGDYAYTDVKTGEARTARVAGGANGVGSESVEEAHYALLESLAPHMSAERLQRMESMMRAYEKRMGDRAMQRVIAGHDREQVSHEIASTLGGTFDQLREMVSTPKGASEVYDQKMRVFLAENFMLHAADPATYDQGNHGSCWMQSGTIANGWTNHADHLARFVKEVALTGQFHSTFANNGQGRTFSFPRGIFALRQGQEESRWSMDNALGSSRRSPIGMILDEGQSTMLGRSSSWSGTYGETARTQFWITGDTPARSPSNVRQTLLEKGAFINFWPGHMLTQQLRRQGDGWVHIQDNQWGEGSDHVIARIDDLSTWNARKGGGRVEHFVPGSNVGDGPIGAYIPDPSVGPAPGVTPHHADVAVEPGGSYVPGGRYTPTGGGYAPGGGYTPGGGLTPGVGPNADVRGLGGGADALHDVLLRYALQRAIEHASQSGNQDELEALLRGPNGEQAKALLEKMGGLENAPKQAAADPMAAAAAQPPVQRVA